MKLIRNQKGLTLIETTIALGILMMGIMSSLTLMLASFNYIRRTEQEIVVVNLAREGIELMRSARNNSEAGGVDLFNSEIDDKNFILDSTDVGNFNVSADYAIDETTISQCDECTLYIKNGKYVHDDTGDPTIFRRLITIKPSNSSNKKIVVSQVSWRVENKSFTYTLEGQLSNWQD